MRRFQLTTVLLIGALALFLTGCSRNPAAPDLHTTAQGGAQASGINTDDAPSDVEGGTPSQVTQAFLAAEEGRLTVGRFTLDLHKNTLRMPATITMRVANEFATEVEIEVSPPEANDFQVQAELWANLSDLADTDYTNVAFLEWDGGDWKQAGEVSARVHSQNVVAKFGKLSTTKIGNKHNVEAEVERQ